MGAARFIHAKAGEYCIVEVVTPAAKKALLVKSEEFVDTLCT
jgi:hypothetical protein